jgi:hypothetical protein
VTRRTLRHIAATLVGLPLLGLGLSLDAQDVVKIRLRGRFFAEPATVRITVAVAPDSANRALRVEADGDRLFRSTEVALEGARGQKIHVVEFKNLPAGHYIVRAAVFSNLNVRGAAEDMLVVGDPSDPR